MLAHLGATQKQKRNLTHVFLPSTFRDMTRERKHLNKVIFPKVRQLDRKRGVQFTVIDLRWEVTESEFLQGFVVSTIFRGDRPLHAPLRGLPQ